jgi:hypothetical protein
MSATRVVISLIVKSSSGSRLADEWAEAVSGSAPLSVSVGTDTMVSQ